MNACPPKARWHRVFDGAISVKWSSRSGEIAILDFVALRVFVASRPIEKGTDATESGSFYRLANACAKAMRSRSGG